METGSRSLLPAFICRSAGRGKIRRTCGSCLNSFAEKIRLDVILNPPCPSGGLRQAGEVRKERFLGTQRASVHRERNDNVLVFSATC